MFSPPLSAGDEPPGGRRPVRRQRRERHEPHGRASENREKGDVRPGALGGDRRSGRIEAQAELMLRAVRDAGYHRGGAARRAWLASAARLRATGRCSDFFARHQITREKRPRTPASRTVPMFPDGARPGSRPSPNSTRSGWSSSTRPGRRPTWPGTHGRARPGRRAPDASSLPHGHWKTTTVVAALTLRRHDRPLRPLRGRSTATPSRPMSRRVLVPELRPGDIVVMDNLSSHKGPEVRALRIESGRRSAAPLPPALQPGLQPDRERLRKAEGAASQGRRQDGGCPRSGHRLRPRRVPSRRVRKLLHKLGLRARLIRKCPRGHFASAVNGRKVRNADAPTAKHE